MKRSFSYNLVAFVLKLKGLKKIFSKDPIDYKKLRKEDVKQPKGSFYKKNSKPFKILDSSITELISTDKKKKIVLFFPGGAFVSGPTTHHWDTLKEIYKKTNCTIWLCDYPKAPEHKITQITNNIDAVYTEALKKYNHKEIILMGDSVGGTLTIALVQRLVREGRELPSKIILISPVLDASMSNSQIDEIDAKDILLAKKGVLSAKRMCAENNNLNTPKLSPISGSFEHFPETVLYLGTQDIMYPDEQIMVRKLKESNIKHKVVLGEGMPHIWPFLPVLKEAKLALSEIIAELNV